MESYLMTQQIGALLYKALKCLRKFEKYQKPENIHQLRVNIKKLRSIFSFLRKTGSNVHFPKKICRKLFQNAGNLRQMHLNQELIEQYPELSSLAEYVEIKDLEAEFIRKMPKYNQSIVQVMGFLRLKFKLPKKKKIKKYFLKELLKAYGHLEQSSNDRALHHFRMQIKKLMHIYEFLPLNIQKVLPLNVVYIDELQNQIGIWHDLSAVIEYFENIENLPSEFEIIKVKEQKAKADLMKELENFAQKVFSVSELK